MPHMTSSRINNAPYYADNHDDLLLCHRFLLSDLRDSRHSDSDCLRHLERYWSVSYRDIQCVCLQTIVAMASHRWTRVHYCRGDPRELIQFDSVELDNLSESVVQKRHSAIDVH